MQLFSGVDVVEERNIPGVQIGKHVSLGPQAGAPYQGAGYQGAQQGPYPYHQAGGAPASGPAVYIGKQVSVGQPGYNQPSYQPTGTYNGAYATGADSPGPYSYTGAYTLGPCVNNGKYFLFSRSTKALSKQSIICFSFISLPHSLSLSLCCH